MIQKSDDCIVGLKKNQVLKGSMIQPLFTLLLEISIFNYLAKSVPKRLKISVFTARMDTLMHTFSIDALRDS